MNAAGRPPARLTFQEILAVGERLKRLGLKPAHPAKDVICYAGGLGCRLPRGL